MSRRKALRVWAAALRKHVRPGRVLLIDVAHDAGCAIYSPARTCNCDPHRILKTETGVELARVEGAGPYCPAEFLGAAG